MCQIPAASCRKVTSRSHRHVRKDEEKAKNSRESKSRKAQAAAVLQSAADHRRRDRGAEGENERNWIRSNIRAVPVENI
jgi:hypothetical protein